MPASGARRSEILATAAQLFASSGLRVSLEEIADACGIRPGTLYHHFDSKEAMIVELVRHYEADLNRVARQARATNGKADAQQIEDRIIELGREIASCGVRHRAALLLTLYDPPTVLGDELTRLARRAPVAVEKAMLEIVHQGRDSGVIRPEVDVTLLGYRLCQSMLHVGVGVSHATPRAEQVPELRLRILLHGVGTRVPANGALDRSASVKAVKRAVREWGDETEDSDRTAHLRAVARKEFGRRGYEATTMRDIAASAGLSIGTVYREFSSKDDLLRSIMSTYAEKVKAAWHAALRAESSPLEKLDALMLADIHVIERFSDEFRIQLAWLRQSPPTSDTLGPSLVWHLRQLRSLLAEGARSGDFRVDGPTADIRARCVGEALASPPTIVQAGPSLAHSLARDTVLRGAIRSARQAQ